MTRYIRDFSTFHVGTAQRGLPCGVDSIFVRKCDHGPYGPCDHVPGCASVDHDGKRHFYHVPRHEAGAFRRWADSAFAFRHGLRLTGRYPHYSVD